MERSTDMTDWLSHTFMEPEPLVCELQELFHISSLVWSGTGWLEGPGVGGSLSPGHWGSEFSPSWWTRLVRVLEDWPCSTEAPSPTPGRKVSFSTFTVAVGLGSQRSVWQPQCSSYDLGSLEFSAFRTVCPEGPASCRFSLRCSCPGSGFPQLLSVDESLLSEASPLCVCLFL